ncbi:hypothetical protein FF3_00534 [Fretibacterium fastidiosum]|uniref:Uncharacterized protein n=2 Tax=Fretibacterium fastidiosum TaxID=651822 RepID=A0AB94IXR0_9BACT|nr:hypothetical protein SY1_14920 [Fretibacterium fastidiosum]
MMRMGDVSLRRVGTVLLVALVAAGAFALRAEAVTEIPMLEVTGTLERVEPVEGGELLVLKVDGKEASGPLFSDCHFLDERGTLIPKEEFLRRYMKRYVTAELSEAEGLIYVCRVKTDA